MKISCFLGVKLCDGSHGTMEVVLLILKKRLVLRIFDFLWLYDLYADSLYDLCALTKKQLVLNGCFRLSYLVHSFQDCIFI